MSCKNEKKKNEVIFNFGLENKVIVDSNLMIPDTGIFIHERIDGNNIDTSFFANKDYWFSPCFIDNDTLKIIRTSGLSNYRLIINKDSNFIVNIYGIKNWIEDVYKSGFENIEILKQRLIINRINFHIGDTIKIKYYSQTKYHFSNRIDTIIRDSICFEYVVKQKSEELNIQFTNKYLITNNSDLPMNHMLYSKFFNKNIIVDSTLYIPESIKNNRVGTTFTFQLHYNDKLKCFYKDGKTYLNLNNGYYGVYSDNFYLLLSENDVKCSFDSIDFHNRSSCVKFGDEYSQYKQKIIVNKKHFNIGDSLKIKAYFISKSNSTAIYNIYLDSSMGQFIVHPYNKNIHKELLSKFPK